MSRFDPAKLEIGGQIEDYVRDLRELQNSLVEAGERRMNQLLSCGSPANMESVCEIRDTLLEVTMRRETATNLWIQALTTADEGPDLRVNRESVNTKIF